MVIEEKFVFYPNKTEDSEEKEKSASENNEQKESVEESEAPMAVAGYLNLAADFAHNFTDGLAIGKITFH